MKRLLIKLIVIMVPIIVLVSFLASFLVHAEIVGNTTCETIDGVIAMRKSRFEKYATQPGSRLYTQTYREWQEAIQWKENNCGGCTVTSKPFADENLNIPLNESGYIIHKYSSQGESVFCIDPDTVYNPCATYNQGGNDLGDDLKVRIAKIVKAANNLGSPGNTEMYIGAQLYIWDILGLSRTVAGIDKGLLKAQIDGEVAKLEQAYKPDINGTHVVTFKQDFTFSDKNAVLERGDYNIGASTAGFAKVERNANEVTININSIYPKIKTVRATPKRGSVNSYQGITFTSGHSQKLFGFNAPLSDIYLEDAVHFKLDTGNLKIQKVDEFGNPNYPNVEYKIYFAVAQADGSYDKGDEIRQEDGSAWVTNHEGQIIINEILPVGKYIINEVKVTNPLVLEGGDHIIEIRSNETTSFTQENDLREISYKIYKEDKEDLQRLDGAEFVVYDVSDYLDEHVENHTISTLHVASINQQLDLNTYFNTTDLTFSLVNKAESLSTDDMQVALHKIAELDLHTNILSTKKVGTVKLQDNNNQNYTIFITNTINDSPSAVEVFKGISGKKYIQVVKDDQHNLFIANASLDLYRDHFATDLLETVTTDEYGRYEITKEFFEKHSVTSIFYKDHKNRIKELSNTFDEGLLEIPHLLHSRDYIACEINPNENYRWDEDSCVKLNSNLDEGINESSITFTNQKGTGDLTLVKLNEWKQLKGEGSVFEIYKAALKDETLPYYKNFKNIQLQLDGKPIISGDPIEVNGSTDITIDSTSLAQIKDQLTFGYYVLKEKSITNSFKINEKLYLLYIESSQENKYDFINENREVEISILKADEEENFRKLNDATFTLYDVSDVQDLDLVNTKYGLSSEQKLDIDKQDLKAYIEKINEDLKPISMSQTQILTPEQAELAAAKNYTLETIYMIKPNKTINLYDFLVVGSDFEKEVEHLPLVYDVKGKKTSLTGSGDLTVQEPTVIEVTVKGGNNNLYSNLEDAIAYQHDVFNPYEGLVFYKDLDGKQVMDVKTIYYTGVVDTSTIGTYTINYILQSKDNVIYTFNRNIQVKEDTRPVYDEMNKVYRDKTTNEVIKDYEEELPKASQIIRPLITTGKTLPEGYEGKVFASYTIQVTNNDDMFTTDTHKQVALPLQRVETGKQYIQDINSLNHNIYLKDSKEIILYYDEALTIPAVKAALDDMAQFEISSLKPTVKKQGDEIASITYPAAKNVELINPSISYIFNPTNNSYEVSYIDLAGMKQVYTSVDKPILSTNLYYPSKTQENKVYTVDTAETQDGLATFKHLKHDRKYLICETNLPEGYDYINNTCVLVDTNDYKENEITKTIEISNKKRRLDLILYKTNASKKIKLDGAIFDVWNTFENGQDRNDLTKDIPVKITKDKLKLVDKILGETDKGSCDIYQDANKIKQLVAINPNTNKTLIYDKEIDTVGNCYEVYKAELISPAYIGRYVTGGIYLKLEISEEVDGKEMKKPLANTSINLYTDKETTNKVGNYTSDKGGEVVITGLPDGIYYSKIERPLKPNFNQTSIDPTGKTIINLPKDDDYIPYDQLPETYSKVQKHYVSKGMIRLPEVKYGENILFKEIKAPSGYYFDDSLMEIIPKADYGIDYMENYRMNRAIIIPNLGIENE